MAEAKPKFPAAWTVAIVKGAGDSSASGSDTAFGRMVNKKGARLPYQRVRVTPTGTNDVQPYTNDENYNKIPGAPYSTQPKITGNIDVTCYLSANSFGDSASRSFVGKAFTMRLPVTNPYACRFRVSASAMGVAEYPSVDVATTVNVVVDLVR